MAEQKRKITPLYICFSRNAIEERIIMIMKTKKISKLSILLAIVLVMSTTTVFATTTIKNSEMPLVIQELYIAKDSSNEEGFKVNISVPDLRGRTYEEACSMLQHMGLSFKIEK
jgi:beta-lactam-binding protein with PASTA domain